MTGALKGEENSRDEVAAAGSRIAISIQRSAVSVQGNSYQQSAFSLATPILRPKLLRPDKSGLAMKGGREGVYPVGEGARMK